MPAQGLKNRLDELGFDPGFPLAHPILLIFVAGVVVWERRFESETERKSFFFLVHRVLVVAIQQG